MAKKKNRKANQGRHYPASEWVEFILDGAAESEGYDSGKVYITEELKEEVARYEEAVDKAIEKCSKRFPPTEDIPADDDASIDLYFTITESGAGIWDGRWDHYYPNYTRGDWEALGKCYKEHLGKFAEITGSGSLEEAFRNAVYAAMPEPFREPDVVNGDMVIWYGPGDKADEIEAVTTVQKGTVTDYTFLGGYESYEEGVREWLSISTSVDIHEWDEMAAAVGVEEIAQQGGDEDDELTTEDLVDMEILPPDGLTWKQWKKQLQGKRMKPKGSTSQLKNKLLK